MEETNLLEHGVVRSIPNKKVSIVEHVPTDPSNVNASYSITKTFVSPVLTTVIEKTIDSIVYTKTIVKNVSTMAETITSWS